MATAETYDFFIAYASPDQEQKENVCGSGTGAILFGSTVSIRFSPIYGAPLCSQGIHPVAELGAAEPCEVSRVSRRGLPIAYPGRA